MTEIYVDADACPVKDEVVRVAERHGLAVHMVSNAWMRIADSPLINRVVVEEGPDVADDWIAAQIGSGDIAVTADIPLAARCIKAGAKVIGPTGKPFTESSIGMALAVRDMMADLNDVGGGYISHFEWGSDLRGIPLPVADVMESLFKSTLDHKGPKAPIS